MKRKEKEYLANGNTHKIEIRKLVKGIEVFVQEDEKEIPPCVFGRDHFVRRKILPRIRFGVVDHATRHQTAKKTLHFLRGDGIHSLHTLPVSYNCRTTL